MPITLEGVSHTYGKGTPFEKKALDPLQVTIHDGDFIGIIGHTGSGKSTLVQSLVGLIKPTTGRVLVDGQDIAEKTAAGLAAKKKVGMVFQYPEYQLFEETIAADIAFGPKNIGVQGEALTKRVQEAMEFVGLDYQTYKDRSPFHLSGGQMRRVAIAGVIAMKPTYLILDEPSAGLDPVGRREIFAQIQQLHQQKGVTVILISHNMEDIARLANRVLVLAQGRIIIDDEPLDVFAKRRQQLQAAGVDVPAMTDVLQYLQHRGLAVPAAVHTVQEGTQAIYQAIREDLHAH
ncbi:energy-coupling factor transporter ATPase [uncultured Megasphaera sp.]|uniref:energy-coupling factor transporter ATPase n=1 Tax=uncultured Megasphaera sp. TaxID=165188 RepID=UPI00259B991B|nr:energy-coupling factor transporter ATPase [uncultured Megasphaera sp.]